jgi:hypothetical protein
MTTDQRALRLTPLQRDYLLAFRGLPAGAELHTADLRRRLRRSDGRKVTGTQYLFGALIGLVKRGFLNHRRGGRDEQWRYHWSPGPMYDAALDAGLLEPPARPTLPDRIRWWAEHNIHPRWYQDQVFNELLDAAAGNRPATPWQRRTLAVIFPETEGRR